MHLTLITTNYTFIQPANCGIKVNNFLTAVNAMFFYNQEYSSRRLIPYQKWSETLTSLEILDLLQGKQ
jgi:hypothetical protein